MVDLRVTTVHVQYVLRYGWCQTAPDVITACTVLVHKYCTVLFTFSNFTLHSAVHHLKVFAGLPSRCGDVMVYVSDRNQPSLPAPFYSVFYSINSPDSSPFSYSVLPDLFLPYWSVQLHIF